MNNILIQYKGGGYDGCFWEWNYCLIDKKGNFHNIESSGSHGISEKEMLINRITTSKVGSEFFIYNFSNVADLKAFAGESNPQHVLGVAKWIEENEPDISKNYIPLICGECENDADSDEIGLNPNDYQGDGGIGIQYNSLLCHSCESIYTCSYCGGYFGSEADELNENGYCEDCAVEQKEREEKYRAQLKQAEYNTFVQKHNTVN